MYTSVHMCVWVSVLVVWVLLCGEVGAGKGGYVECYECV